MAKVTDRRETGERVGAAFAYSNGMKRLGVVWDADRIAKPKAMVPDTKITYVGMESPRDRIDDVAYLKITTTSTN